MPSRSTNGTNGWWRRERAWGLMRWCRWWVTPISRSQTLLRVFSNTNQFFFGKQISPGGIPNSHWKPHQTFISISYCQWNRVIYTTQTGKSQNPMQKHAPASWKKMQNGHATRVYLRINTEPEEYHAKYFSGPWLLVGYISLSFKLVTPTLNCWRNFWFLRVTLEC